MSDSGKPPIGCLMPEDLFREKRVFEILAAIDRYITFDQSLQIKPEWCDELARHLEWLQKKNLDNE